MPRHPKMTTPITRDDLREELAKHPTRDDLRAELAKHPTRDDLRAELAKHPTRDELRAELAKHPTRDELREALAEHPTHAQLDTALEGWATAILGSTDRKFAEVIAEMRAIRDELRDEMRGMRIELSTDRARHVRASDEQHRSELAIVDEKYADLPERVAALEKR